MDSEKNSLTANKLSLQACLRALPVRKKGAHKGDFGHVLIVGGDYGFGGSVRLAGEAALRSGAGLVTVATRPEHAYAITGNCPELMCHGVANSNDIELLLKRATVVAVGPGLGKNDFGRHLWKRVLQSELPLIVDADALNLLAEERSARHNWVLTPHPGEALRLLKSNSSSVQQDREAAIKELQQNYQGVIVLKGSGTLILGEKLPGERENTAFLCEAGNPGMAVGGMGDILTGVIAALVAQHLPLLDAAKLGVIVHATAGDQAALNGEIGICARDLLEPINQILNRKS